MIVFGTISHAEADHPYIWSDKDQKVKQNGKPSITIYEKVYQMRPIDKLPNYYSSDYKDQILPFRSMKSVAAHATREKITRQLHKLMQPFNDAIRKRQFGSHGVDPRLSRPNYPTIPIQNRYPTQTGMKPIRILNPRNGVKPSVSNHIRKPNCGGKRRSLGRVPI